MADKSDEVHRQICSFGSTRPSILREPEGGGVDLRQQSSLHGEGRGPPVTGVSAPFFGEFGQGAVLEGKALARCVLRQRFRQLYLAPVRILDKSDHPATVLHGARGPRDRDAFGGQRVAGRVDVGNLGVKMSPGVALVLGRLLLRVAGQLDHRVGVIGTVSHEGVAELACGIIFLPQDLHPQQPGVQCAVDIEAGT